MGNKVYIALGSNMGDREKNLSRAIESIAGLDMTRLTGISDIYETDPVGYTEQDKFLNMVVEVSTRLDPLTLLQKLQEIENALKRKREIRWGPRTIDIDILLYGNEKIELPVLTVPHPRMFERAFVMIPLKDVYPQKQISGSDIDNLIDICHDKDGVRRWTVDASR